MPGVHVPATPSFSSSSQLALSPEVHLIWPPVASCSRLTVVEAQIGCSLCAPGCKETLGVYRDDSSSRDPHIRDYASDSMCTSSTAPAAESMMAVTSDGCVVARGQVDPKFNPQHGGPRRVTSRLRIKSEVMGMLTLLFTDSEGRQSHHLLKQSAPFPVMPDMACQELQELMWTMVTETLEDSDHHTYDPSIFSTPFHLLPGKLQNAMHWAWSTHFKPLALDLQYCLDCMPDMQSSGLDSPEVQGYHAVLIPLVAFLRDHECCATLGALLSHCVQKGLEITPGATSMAGSPAPSPPCSPVFPSESCISNCLIAAQLNGWDCVDTATGTRSCGMFDSGSSSTKPVMSETQQRKAAKKPLPSLNKLLHALLVASLLLQIGLSLVTMTASPQQHQQNQQASDCNATSNSRRQISKPLQWSLLTSVTALLLAVAHLSATSSRSQLWTSSTHLVYAILALIANCLPMASLLAWGLGLVDWPVAYTATIVLAVVTWLVPTLLWE